MLDECIKRVINDAIADSMGQLLHHGQLSTIQPTPNRLLSKADVADMLGVSTRTVDRMITDGRLSPGIAIAGGRVRAHRRWRYDDIAQLVR